MSNWVELLCTYDQIEAQLVKDILESEKIEVVTESLKITPYPVNIGRIGEVRLLVQDEDLERAEEILSDFKSAPKVNEHDKGNTKKE